VRNHSWEEKSPDDAEMREGRELKKEEEPPDPGGNGGTNRTSGHVT